MDSDAVTADYSVMLEAMCKWGKVQDVIELVNGWLEQVLVIEDVAASVGGKNSKV